MVFPYDLLTLIGIGFIAGFINILAGGGSLLTLPILIFLGLPPTVANGTNRIAIVIQNIFSVAGFKSKGVSDFPFSGWVAVSAFFGAIIGANIAVDIDGYLFNKILSIVMVVVVIYMVANPKINPEITKERIKGKYFWLSIGAFFLIGIYGGFIQAGVGFIIILALSSINHFTLVKSNAIKVFVALVYNLSSIAIFVYADVINWKYGLFLSVGNALGGWISSRWQVKKGDGFVRVFLIVMIIVLAIKLWFF
ncbi:MAG: sulfite exporter TauE/SafE family protein [Flavobacteriaceae bacterium]|nr:sulfite exporter TauE/SafE family protein [Flavobacteriaceae bacterium]